MIEVTTKQYNELVDLIESYDEDMDFDDDDCLGDSEDSYANEMLFQNLSYIIEENDDVQKLYEAIQEGKGIDTIVKVI